MWLGRYENPHTWILQAYAVLALPIPASKEHRVCHQSKSQQEQGSLATLSETLQTPQASQTFNKRTSKNPSGWEVWELSDSQHSFQYKTKKNWSISQAAEPLLGSKGNGACCEAGNGIVAVSYKRFAKEACRSKRLHFVVFLRLAQLTTVSLLLQVFIFISYIPAMKVPLSAIYTPLWKCK